MNWIQTLSAALWLMGNAMISAAFVVAAGALWFMIVWGVLHSFKRWRLYSHHPLAKLIRKRRQAKVERIRQRQKTSL